MTAAVTSSHSYEVAQARIMLRQNRRKEAAELLTQNFKKQFIKVRTFLQSELATPAQAAK